MQGIRHKGGYEGTIATSMIGPLFNILLEAVSSVTGHTSLRGATGARAEAKWPAIPEPGAKNRERIPSPLDLPPGAALRWGTTLPQPRRRARFGGPSVFLDPAHDPELGSQ